MYLIIWISKSLIIVDKMKPRERHLLVELLQRKFKLTGLFNSVYHRILSFNFFCSLNSKDCKRYAEPIMFQSTSKDVEIPFTYSVKFVENKESSPIQQFSIFNVYFMILLLSIVIGLILLTILYMNTIGEVNKVR